VSRQFYVYILSSASRTLYVGVTNDRLRRLIEHRSGIGSTFTARCNVDRLVYFETTENSYAAVSREKQIKTWRREKNSRSSKAQIPTGAASRSTGSSHLDPDRRSLVASLLG
jgi:putative endonuclease